MSSTRRVTVQDEYKKVIKGLKRTNRILIVLCILLVLLNFLSGYYMYLADPGVNVKKIYSTIKDEVYSIYCDITK